MSTPYSYKHSPSDVEDSNSGSDSSSDSDHEEEEQTKPPATGKVPNPSPLLHRAPSSMHQPRFQDPAGELDFATAAANRRRMDKAKANRRAPAAGSDAEEEDDDDDDDAQHIKAGSVEYDAAVSALAYTEDIETLANMGRAGDLRTIFLDSALMVSHASPVKPTRDARGQQIIPRGTTLFRQVAGCRWEYKLRGRDFECDHLVPAAYDESIEKQLKAADPSTKYTASQVHKFVQWKKTKQVHKDMATIQRVDKNGAFMGEPCDPTYTDTYLGVLFKEKLYFVPIPFEQVQFIRKNTPGGGWGMSTKTENEKTLREARLNKNALPLATDDDDCVCMIPCALYRSLDQQGADRDSSLLEASGLPAPKKRKAAPADTPAAAAAAADGSEEPASKKPASKSPAASASAKPKAKAKLPALVGAEKNIQAQTKKMIDIMLAGARKQTKVTPLEFFRAWRKGLLEDYEGAEDDAILAKLVTRTKGRMPKPDEDGRVLLADVPVARENFIAARRMWLATSEHGKEALHAVDEMLIAETVAADMADL